MNAMLTAVDAERLLSRQIAGWPQARAGYAALDSVVVKTLSVDGFEVKVQFNPARAVSAAAKIDRASLAGRRCFLCQDNRPPQQEAVEWERYSVLVNPFPIFRRHLTIASSVHVAQSLTCRIGEMLRLADSLEGYAIFYNGPHCGASAPDHMHFQAGEADFLPLFTSWCESLTPVDGDISVALEPPVKFFVIVASDIDSVTDSAVKLIGALPKSVDHDEPMVNVFAYKYAGTRRVVVIPRRRHRPEFYGDQGDGTMLISPGAVDMAGVIITPRESDFERLDSETVKTIYKQVSFDVQDINKIITHVKQFL